MAPDPEIIKGLKRQRGSVKCQVTRLLSTITEETDSLSDYQLAIELDNDDPDHEIQRDAFEQQYFEVADLINARLKALRGSPIRSVVTGRSVESPATVMLKQAHMLLPQIDIKPFDGNPLEWHSFRDTFHSLVHESD